MASRPARIAFSPALSGAHLRIGISPIWLGLCLLVAIDIVWLLSSPIRLSTDSWRVVAGLVPFIILGAWGNYRLNDWPRLQMLVEGVTFMLCAWPALRLYNHLTMSAAYPLADENLANADALMGFNWAEYLLWLDRYPLLIRLMDSSYSGLTGYTMILFLLLLLGNEPKQRCQELLRLFFSTAVICSTVGMFFPAEAAAVFYQVPPNFLTHVDPRVGAYHLDHLQALRSDPEHMLFLAKLPGLVTFPSFHTAMGIIAIYCARGTPWLIGPSLIINLVMIASTPLFGSHYLVDIIAGAAVAGGAILFLRHLSASSTE